MIKQGDCLELLKEVPDCSVDAIICDPPFGTTDCSWDIRLPLDEMWTQFKRVTKRNAAIVLFSQLPFACDLINANRKNFRYEIVWEKSVPVGFFNANKMPLRCHENILVFYQQLPTYNPQFTSGKAYQRMRNDVTDGVYQNRPRINTINDGRRYPRDVQRFNSQMGDKFHPTQKPVDLLEYLIKTYTNEGETVLDATMGSGSTGVACVNTNRRFIGFELDEKFFKTAQQRIEEALAKKRQELF